MKARLGRFVSSAVAAAFLVTLLPQPAFAAGSTPGAGGVVDTIGDWFSDDDPDDDEPPSSDSRNPASREKLPAGKAEPAAKRVKELTGRRTPEARFWRMSDGGVEAELAAAPTSYETRGGAWKAIDTAVAESDARGYVYANTTNLARSYFGDSAERLLRVEGELGQSVTFGLKDASGGLKPRAGGDTVTYPDAINGADISYRVGAGEVKEDIVLNERPEGPVSFAFTMDVTEGLTPESRKDGSVAFFHETSSEPVLVIPAPFMTDAVKDASSPYGKAWSPKVTQKLSRHGKQWLLTLTPDAGWLAAKERQYPVKIDPTITIAPSPSQSQDVMVLSDEPGVNFAPAWNLSVGTTRTGVARSLIKFPLNEIPAGVTVDSARLSLYYDQTHTTGDKSVKIEAHEATGPWDETTATWDNTKNLLGDLSGTKVQLDDGRAGTAAVGDWTRIAGAGIESDYRYNQNSATGESYTWQPDVPETASYLTDVYIPGVGDAASAAPYEIKHRGGTANFTVDQRGTSGRWVDLGTEELSYAKGTANTIKLGDTGDASSKNVADAVRLVNRAELWKDVGEYNQWHNFPVKNSVQEWVNGTLPNNGFVLKAYDEGPTGVDARGGPRYEAGDGIYGGETSSIPRLTVSYGRIGTALDSPTVVHGTGPELKWKPYANTTADAGADFVEYQIHRSTQQAFTPSAATLIAPIGEQTADHFTDTTATPSPDPGPEIGKSYYYQIAVKTADGDLLGSPTRIVGIPKAGRTMKLIQGSAGGTVADTTLSSAQPNTNQDTIQSWNVGQNWLSVGNNSDTYGTTRAALDFDTSTIPATATVLEAQLQMWGTETTRDTGSTGAGYELRPLDRSFDETTATWNNANATTAWTKPGGDHSATVSHTVPQWSNEVGRQTWNATSMVHGWVRTPESNKGAMVKLANESATGPRERSLWLSSEGQDQQLGPLMRVIYVDATAESTYYAPDTPQRMTPNSTYNVEVTFTNTTDFTLNANPGTWGLSYRWTLPDGSTPPGLGQPVVTGLPASIPPGTEKTVIAQVKTPINSDSGNKRTDYQLTWDVYRGDVKRWLSDQEGIPGLTQRVAVEDPTSDELGLEKFYSYTGTSTGAGSTVMNNTAAGNAVWSYDAFTNPGRGLNTFFRVAYNSLDTSDTITGHGWSAQAAGPLRLGAPLDFHPNPRPTEVRWPDGDGTTHVFRKQEDGTFKAPAGVHYKLEPKLNLDCTPAKDPIPDAWTATRPDGTRFYFGCDGYLTSVVDPNGNTQTYTYTERKSNNKPVKFLDYITDPAGRKSLEIEYYQKGDASYDFINDAGQQETDTGKLNNSKIYDHIKSVTDISGRKLAFFYTTKGLLGRMVDGAGSAQPKEFDFTYDAAQGNKNVKLTGVQDPRQNTTRLEYNAPGAGDNPKYHWWTKTITDRLQNPTGFVYAPDTGNVKFTDTTVTDAQDKATTYVTDDFGRPVKTTNAKNETTELSWDADNNVTLLREANGAETAYCYDPATGYPRWQRDAEQNKAAGGVPDPAVCTDGATPDNATAYEYSPRVGDEYVKDLWHKTSPEGHTWTFTYDEHGNLLTVTDPKGTATEEAGDYTTRYTYDGHGQLQTATDPRDNTTINANFTPTGYPELITDPKGNGTDFVYDERGQVLKVVDARKKTTTQTYDTYGRPGESVVPKDQDAGEFITTPAPVYDANDNITRATAPNGAVSTAVYDEADQTTSATAPDNNTTGRETRYTYDRVGNLLTTTEPKGVATADNPDDFVTTNTYDAIYQLTDLVNADGDKLSYRYDDVGNVTHVIDPKKNETPDTTDFTTHTTYDRNHRPETVTDAAGETTTTTYDKDSLVIARTDQAGKTTEVDYDQRGLPVEQRVPYTDTTTRTTKFTYDQAGNPTKVETPRGVNTATPDDYTHRTTYDELNRPERQYQPYEPADARYNNPDVYTETLYDEVGRVKTVSAPPSEGQTVRNETTYEYFDTGWIRTATDPWEIKTEYDYNDLGQQKSRLLTSAGGSSKRPMDWAYYPDGSLQTKKDSGVPDGSAVVLVDNSDTQHTSTSGSWKASKSIPLSGDPKDTGFNHRSQASGNGTFTWQTVVPRDGEYTAYAKYPQKSDAGTATYRIDHAGGPATKKIDQAENANSWVKLGTYRYKQGTKSITVSGTGQGTVSADAVKLVRSYEAAADTEEKVFGYRYDLNGNLTDIDDTSSGAKIDAYTMAYTGLNQLEKVTENLAGEEKKATAFTYDANGQPETVTHPDQWAGYTYNARNLLETVKIADTTSETDPTRKTTSYTYTPRGMVDTETKANGNLLDHDYYANGALKTDRETNDGALVASHAYDWDPNGNKARDVFSRMNADTGALADTTSTYTYDPADRIAKLDKTGLGAGTETYRHDANANVVEQTVDGVNTRFDYNLNRLQQATATGDGSGGLTSAYTYDPYGRLETVTADGKILEQNAYDGFDHVAEHTKLQADDTTATTKYIYDPLDRTTSKTTDVGSSSPKTTDFTYLGLSKEVLDERVGSEITKSYQYGPGGQRLSQITHKPDGTQQLGVYGYNSHSDVETVTGEDGDTDATYGYTAYGTDNDAEFTGIDKPDPVNPDKEAFNPYRFNAKRWDASTSTYDMGFRNYSPGLNRFLTRDTYNGALADMQLGTDPTTGNRYAFTGGNPTTNIELDGHRLACGGEGGEAAACPSGHNQNTGYIPSPDEEIAITPDEDGSSIEVEGQRIPTEKELAALYPTRSYQEQIEMWTANRCHNPEDQDSFCDAAEDLGWISFDSPGLDVLGVLGIRDAIACVKERDGGACAWVIADAATRGASKVLRLGRLCTRHSFTPGTRVLLADGQTRKIEDVEIGDRVVVTDPDTGKTTIRTVKRLITTHDDKKFVRLTLTTKNGQTGQLTATTTHPFWAEYAGEWINAGDLLPGTTIRTTTGGTATVQAADHYTKRQTTHDLTIRDIHTYYVLAGNTPVLVHNAGGAACVRAGQVGETAAGITKNTEKLRINGRTRIPDELDHTAGVIGEVKNVKYQHLSTQIRDDLQYAAANGYQFKLYVRGSTRLSGPLQARVNSGEIDLIRNLP
ncbi:DNRLRE domain-containing protein [Streptomyces sp. NPDC004134]|uniref:DNRLRE domain-containing protein n=1 Tax=Streptomyces sp. NPDC004134 TaxID=3364691 RepID=UPI0036839E17